MVMLDVTQYTLHWWQPQTISGKCIPTDCSVHWAHTNLLKVLKDHVRAQDYETDKTIQKSCV
jgi:hypothetical protein